MICSGNATRFVTTAFALLATVATVVVSAADPVVSTARERAWVKSSAAAGAEEAFLWGSAASSDQGVLTRWPSRTKLKPTSQADDLHILVLAGTFTVEYGQQYRELGPGGFALIPGGVLHTLGCEAAGECLFLVHRSGASTNKPN